MNIHELSLAYYFATKVDDEYTYEKIMLGNAKQIIDVLKATLKLVKSDRIDCDYTWIIETMYDAKDVPRSPIHSGNCRACELRKAIEELER